MKNLITIAVLALSAAVALADGTVQQKTQVKLGGAVGAIANVFGGRATHEGIESSVALKGNRKASRTGGRGEIVDLAEEKVYRVDYDEKTYTVLTFDELRKQIEEQRARAERNSQKASKDKSRDDGPEYEVEFSVKETGQKETINGFHTRQTIATVTVHEKGKTLDEAGGFVLTSDMWMGPKIQAMSDIASFDRKYFQKVYGSSISSAEMTSAAALLATTPAFAKAMKVFAEKRGAFEGTPIRTNLTFETVGTPAGQSESASSSDSSPASAASAIMGGLMNRMKKRQAEKNAEKAQNADAAKTSGPERSALFTSTNEILGASASAPAELVSLAGFKKE
jgi:hypothetical protein